MPIIGGRLGRARHFGRALLLAVAAGPVLAAEPGPPLAAYNADIAESSISSVSSGAFMAIQFGVACYVYVPAACERRERCRIHIALHGCEQYAGKIGDAYTAHAGYNEWAAANRILVLYPQATASLGAPLNPYGC